MINQLCRYACCLTVFVWSLLYVILEYAALSIYACVYMHVCVCTHECIFVICVQSPVYLKTEFESEPSLIRMNVDILFAFVNSVSTEYSSLTTH